MAAAGEVAKRGGGRGQRLRLEEEVQIEVKAPGGGRLRPATPVRRDRGVA